MKSRPRPDVAQPPRMSPASLKHDAQVIKWVKRLEGDPQATPLDVDEQRLKFIVEEIHRRRGQPMNSRHFERALEKTRPVLAAPISDKPIRDLRDHVFAQPEMRQLWRRWQPDLGARGTMPRAAEAKALMCLLGMTGHSTHINDIHEQLADNEPMRRFFADLEAEALRARAPELQDAMPGSTLRPAEREAIQQAMNGNGPAELVLPDYTRVGGLMKKLATSSALHETWKANVAMLKALKEIYPEIGTRLMVESTSHPSWSVQKGSAGDDSVEAGRRKHAPDSGFRAIRHTGAGKRDLSDTDGAASVARSGAGKWWRGWYAQGIFDQATGLLIVGRLFDAATDEAHGIVPLLSLLFDVWPELHGEAEMLAGDSAFDEDQVCRLLEVDYGIHPIFRWHRGGKKSDFYDAPAKASRDEAIAGHNIYGQLKCRKHKKLLRFEGFEGWDGKKRTATGERADKARDGRGPLRPGESAPEHKFRIRAVCPACAMARGSGRLGYRAMFDWSLLTYYPHYDDGRPDLYAMRMAMLGRVKNQAESYWQRLKSGKKVATNGTDRSRLNDRPRAEMLFALACTSITALTLADQRQQHGIHLDDLTPPTAPTPHDGEKPAPEDATIEIVVGANGHDGSDAASPSATDRATDEARSGVVGVVEHAPGSTVVQAVHDIPASAVIRQRGGLLLIRGGAA